MTRFVLLSFAFLGWAFYEMSGGADFKPPSRIAAEDTARNAPAATGSDPASPATMSLASLHAPMRATDLIAQVPLQIAVAEPAPLVRSAAQSAVADLPLTRRTPVAPAAIAPAAAPSVEPEPKAASEDAPAPPDMRHVTGASVNLRQGPGTGHPVLTQLGRGAEVEVLRREGNWLKLRVVSENRIGWMSAALVSAPAG